MKVIFHKKKKKKKRNRTKRQGKTVDCIGTMYRLFHYNISIFNYERVRTNY